MNGKKREKGFSLVELILSIAALAILSGFILQMFLTASQVNVRADEFDQSTLLCEAAMETALTRGDYAAREIYYDKQWDETSAELATYRLVFTAEQLGDTLDTPLYISATSSATESAPEHPSGVSSTIMWELRSQLTHIEENREICNLSTRQIVQLPDEEVVAQ